MKPIKLEYKTYEKLKEELGNEYDTAMYEINISALKEIERLNNIINELEKWCKEQAKDFRENNKPFCYEYESIADEYKNILDKLQELKGE